MVGKATGKTNKADEIVKGMKEKLAQLKAKAEKIKEKKKVYIEVSPAPEIYTPGKNTFMDEMIRSINAENIANDQQGWIKVDQEAIIQTKSRCHHYYIWILCKKYGRTSANKKRLGKRERGKKKQVIDINSDRVNRSRA